MMIFVALLGFAVGMLVAFVVMVWAFGDDSDND